MRIAVEFQSESGIRIPVKYNYYFQSLLYSLAPKSNVHDRGFGERNYKLLTFSRPIGKCKYLKESGVLLFENGVKWVVSSVDDTFLEEVATNLIKANPVALARQRLSVRSIEVMKIPPPEVFKRTLTVKMLSPMTVYSTLHDAAGNKKTYFYTPFEDAFSEKLRENLERKFKALYESPPTDGTFEIQPVNPRKEWEKITIYKKTVIKGWMGIYRIQGNPELLRLAYDSGLGSRNSQGFGCFEITHERR